MHIYLCAAEQIKWQNSEFEIFIIQQKKVENIDHKENEILCRPKETFKDVKDRKTNTMKYDQKLLVQLIKK